MNTIFGNFKVCKKQKNGGRVYSVEFIDHLEMSKPNVFVYDKLRKLAQE